MEKDKKNIKQKQFTEKKKLFAPLIFIEIGINTTTKTVPITENTRNGHNKF